MFIATLHAYFACVTLHGQNNGILIQQSKNDENIKSNRPRNLDLRNDYQEKFPAEATKLMGGS